MFSAYFTVILTVIFRVHHLPLHLADVILLPPGVGGDADLQGGVEEPEPDLVGGDADLQEGVDVLTHPNSISIILFHHYFL